MKKQYKAILSEHWYIVWMAQDRKAAKQGIKTTWSIICNHFTSINDRDASLFVAQTGNKLFIFKNLLFMHEYNFLF